MKHEEASMIRRTATKMQNTARGLGSALGGLALAAALVSGAGVMAPSPAQAAVASAASAAALSEIDQITFKDGRIVKGEILEETDTTVRMRVVMFGTSAETTYQKSDILAISRGVAQAPAAEAPATGRNERSAPRRPDRPREAQVGAEKVYVIELLGEFGRDISQTPIREAVEDARKNGADVVLFVLENDWSANAFEERGDEEGAFDQFFRAEAMFDIFKFDLKQGWDEQPRVAFWVKRGMGGAAFLPLISKEIYFHPEGKIGGLGNLEYQFGSTGDEVVRQKQISLRLKTAEGAALLGGYDPQIVEAMAMLSEVFSYRIEGGRAVIVRGYPDPAKGEILLTDDGQEDREDTIQQLARNQGNDVLTLDATLAQRLGVSKGTAATVEDVVFQMGLGRGYEMIEGQSDRIMQGWTRSLVNAERQLRELWEQFGEIQVGGDRNDRRRARAMQIRTLERMIAVIRKYEEAVIPQRLGVPPRDWMETRIAQIRLEQLADN